MDHFFLPAHLLQNIPVFTIDYSMILFTIVDSFNFVPQFAVQFIHFSLIDCHDSTTLLLNWLTHCTLPLLKLTHHLNMTTPTSCVDIAGSAQQSLTAISKCSFRSAWQWNTCIPAIDPCRPLSHRPLSLFPVGSHCFLGKWAGVPSTALTTTWAEMTIAATVCQWHRVRHCLDRPLSSAS